MRDCDKIDDDQVLKVRGILIPSHPLTRSHLVSYDTLCFGEHYLTVSDETRNRLAAWACSRRTRTREFRPNRPCKWQATSITDPRSGEIFTEDGAWEYAAQMILDGVAIEVVELRQPPGKKAYAMLVPSHDPATPIYVKLQLGSGCVIGRSFHYSTTFEQQQKEDDR
jgi:hypothetical protein